MDFYEQTENICRNSRLPARSEPVSYTHLDVYKRQNFICTHGQYSDLLITEKDGAFFLNTFGIYIDRIADMDYREELLKVLITMQKAIDGTDEIDCEESEDFNMEMN